MRFLYVPRARPRYPEPDEQHHNEEMFYAIIMGIPCTVYDERIDEWIAFHWNKLPPEKESVN